MPPPTLLILDLNARRLRAKVCSLRLDGELRVQHDDVYRFHVSAVSSSKRSTVYPQDVLIAISVILERVHSAMRERMFAIQAITCIVDYAHLPTAKVYRDQQQTLRTFNPAQTLAEQLCLPVSEPTGYQDHFHSAMAGQDTGKTVSAGALMRSILVGRLLDMDAIEAAHASTRGHRAFESEPMETLSSSVVSMQDRLFGALPDRVSVWMVARFGFCSSCVVTAGLLASMASLLSFCPEPSDVGIGIGRSDELLVPTSTRIVLPDSQALPNILVELDNVDLTIAHLPWLVSVVFTDAGHARKIIRDVYTKTRHAFHQLVHAVCPGGSVGLDTKLFTLYRPAICSTASDHRTDSEGSFQRYENGTRVAEFGDLRANARCLVEGQALAVRHAFATIKTADCGQDGCLKVYRGAAGCMVYAPFDASNLPARWCTWGRSAGDACIASVFTQVLGASMLVSKSDVDAAQVEDDKVYPRVSRATIGAVYVAAYLLYRQGVFATTPLSFTAFVRQQACQTSAFVPSEQQLSAYCELSRAAQPDFDPDITPRPIHRRQSMWMGRPPRQDEFVMSRRNIPPRAYYPSLAAGQRERSSSGSTDAASRTRSSTLSSLQSTEPSETDDDFDYPISTCLTPKLGSPAISPPSSPSSTHSHALVSLAEPDHDFWLFYGAMLEEYNRLLRPT